MGVVATVYIDGIPLSEHAIVHIESHPVPAVKGDVVRRMNPKKIEELAMGHYGWGNEKSLVTIVLEIVAELLDATD